MFSTRDTKFLKVDCYLRFFIAMAMNTGLGHAALGTHEACNKGTPMLWGSDYDELSQERTRRSRVYTAVHMPVQGLLVNV